MTPAEQFLANLSLVERVIAYTAARHHLSRTDRDEFASFARLKLIEDDYRILRQFHGRSQLGTYLVTVVKRLFLDYRIGQWGKWRPSAQALRLGNLAVQLERLLTRDHLSHDEAFEQLQATLPEPPSRTALEELAAQLPVRVRRQTVGEDQLVNVRAANPAADAGLVAADRAMLRSRAVVALKSALADLDPTERSVIVLRYNGGLTVPRIATMLHLEVKPLYRRMDQLREQLRAALEAAGVSAADVSELLSDPEPALPVAHARPLTLVAGGAGRTRPSN